MGFVSKVKNKHSGIKFVISTAKEIGKDYWSSVVAESKFFGIWMKWNNRLTWIRNSEEDAYQVHTKLKEVIENMPKELWLEHAPKPNPPEGFSKDAQKTFQKKIGFIPNEDQINPKMAEKILNEFGKILEEAGHMTFGAPISLLPYKKETIKEAIKINIDLLKPEDHETRNLLETGYIQLALFIPDEEAEIASKGQLALMSKDLMNKDLQYTEEAIKISERITEEQKILLNEIKKYRRRENG